LEGDASVNVWGSSPVTGHFSNSAGNDSHYWYDVYDSRTGQMTNSTARSRVNNPHLSFDANEIEALNEAVLNQKVDIVDVRASGPGYLAMSTEMSKGMTGMGFFEDMLNGADLPMRTGPWGFTRRPPFNWHTSRVDIAAMSFGSLKPQAKHFDLTMKHGFCPSFHRKSPKCLPWIHPDNYNGTAAAATSILENSHTTTCISEYQDKLYDRPHRSDCDPSWASNFFVLIFPIMKQFYCRTPFAKVTGTLGAYGPEMLTDFNVDASVFSGMMKQGVKNVGYGALAEDVEVSPLITSYSWGLDWDTFEFAFFLYDDGTQETAIESTEGIKRATSWVIIILYWGSAIMMLMAIAIGNKFMQVTIAQFKLEILMSDELVRHFVSAIITEMEYSKIDVAADGKSRGDGVISVDELKKLRKTALKQIVTASWVSQAENFIYDKLAPDWKENSVVSFTKIKLADDTQALLDKTGVHTIKRVTSTPSRRPIAELPDEVVHMDREMVLEALRRIRLLTGYIRHGW
jgi:hypothetical protein